MTDTHTRLAAQFRAGRTRRWHANAWLADTNDRVDGHAARVARIILALHPAPTLALLAAALVHDDGENGETGIGDIPGPVRNALPAEARLALDEREANARLALWPKYGGAPARTLTGANRTWLHFADRLDALMWVAWHRPELLQSAGWREDVTMADHMAQRVDADVDVRRLLAEVAQ